MASIKDVAKEAGVSIGTVDRIIHERGRFSKETALRVKKAMERLDYQPNFHARGLRNQSAAIFYALIPLPEQDSGYWELIVNGIQRASVYLSSYGSKVKIKHFDRYKAGDFTSSLKTIFQKDCSGLLIAPVVNSQDQDELIQLQIPFLFIDTDLPRFEKQRLTYLGEDSLQSGRLAGKMLNLLLSTSKEPHLWMVCPVGGGSHLNERQKGFRQYIEETRSKWTVHNLEETSDNLQEFYASLDRALDQYHGLPQGIFVTNSLVYHAASWMETKGIPAEKVALVGYDLIPGKDEYIRKGIIDFILTQQPEEQGYQGILMLYRHLVLKRDIPEKWIAPLNIITRENVFSFEKTIRSEI